MGIGGVLSHCDLLDVRNQPGGRANVPSPCRSTAMGAREPLGGIAG
jgi:hypothetical protein